MWADRSRFLKALHYVRPALGDQEGGNLLHFLGWRVSAFNGELRISASLPYRLDMTGAVPAKKLIDIVGKKGGQDIEIDCDQEQVHLIIDGMKVRIFKDATTLSMEGIPDIADESWFNLPKDFKEKLNRLYFSISKNLNYPVLTCVHWRGRILEACDNTRFTRCTLSSPLPDGYDLLFPGEAAAVLKSRDYDPTHFSIEAGWLYFKCSGGIILSCRLYPTEFPPIEKIISLTYGKPFRLPADLTDILKGADKVCPQDALLEPYILVALDEGILTVVLNKENNLIKNRFVNSNENIRFWINPDVLREILDWPLDRVAVSEKIEGEFERFLKFDGDGLTHIIGVAPALNLPNFESNSTSPVSESRELEPVAMYCAGTEGAELERKLLQTQMKNRLLSYAFVNHTMYDKYLADPYRQNYQNIMFDSGAFSVWKRGKTIDLDEYTEYCKSKIDKVDYFVSLDVIPGKFGQKNLRLMTAEIDQSALSGYANYRIMLKNGIPKTKLLHVFHQGEQFGILQKMVEEVPYLGLSPGNDRSPNEKISWLMDCMRYVTDHDGWPLLPFHGFAVTSLRIVRLFPWASVDSATWGISAGNGSVMIPIKRGGKWDFSSDTPLKVDCSHIKDSPDHIDNQPKLVQETTINPYLESLGLKRGKSTYSKRKLSEKLGPSEKKMSRDVGCRVFWAQSSFDDSFGKSWKDFAKELAEDEVIVETIDELGVLNSVEIRNFLNVYYLNQFLKTLPKDRRFVRPQNRVDLRWYLSGSYDGPEDDSLDIEERIEKKIQEIISRAAPKPSPLPMPVKGERKKKASKASRVRPTMAEPKSASFLVKEKKSKKQTIVARAVHPKRSGKRLRVKGWDSVKKILFKYFATLTKVPFTAMGKTVEPKPLLVSQTLARGYKCHQCGGCCREFSVDYLPGEAPQKGVTERFFEFNGQSVHVFSDVQKERAGLNCRNLDNTNGQCRIHKTHPLSCDFELIRCYMGAKKTNNRIGIGPYGRGHSYERVDGGTGALCEILEPGEDAEKDRKAIEDTIKKLRRLDDWATYFGLTEHHIPALIDFLATNQWREGNKWLFPKDWTPEQRKEFLKKQSKKQDKEGEN